MWERKGFIVAVGWSGKEYVKIVYVFSTPIGLFPLGNKNFLLTPPTFLTGDLFENFPSESVSSFKSQNSRILPRFTIKFFFGRTEIQYQ